MERHSGEGHDRNGLYFTVKEVNVPTHFVAEHNGLTVTNTYVPEQTTFTATKVWEGGPQPTPTAVFQLYRQVGTDETTKEKVDDLIFVKGDEHTWENLPTTNASGAAYSYWVEEENIPANYTPESGIVTGNKQTITNTYTAPKANITAHKDWIGGPVPKPDITLVLERRIGETGAKEEVEEETLLAGDPDHTWINMPLNDENGNAYIYSVREKVVPANYTVSYNGMTVTNTYAIPKEGEVTGKKIWDGGPTTGCLP